MFAVIKARNHTEFLYEAIDLVLSEGKSLSPRNRDVLEVENVIFEIEIPTHKQLFIPLRGNNPIATIAEVLWVLAGRNDMEYLSYYLPRAMEFSDDGKVWRGGYGPRLRNWNHVDQLREVVRILETDRDSRRAVMVIYDPDRDFVKSKDIPCNNQLAFTVRDERLNMKVCSRSMDIIWGSTVNIITWSILQEILAGIMNAQVGTLTYFVSSFHLYTPFVEKSKTLLRARGSSTPYSNGHTPTLTFDRFSSVDNLDAWLEMMMETERVIRNGGQYEDLGASTSQRDLLSCQLTDMFLIRRHLYEGNLLKAKEIIDEMEDTDFARAIAYYVDENRL